MMNWEIAATAMIAVSSVGFLLSDGERRRLQWIRAMRRCLMRLSGLIRYEQPPLAALLERVDLSATPQEKALTRMLCACARRIKEDGNRQMALLFAEESAHVPDYGVLSEEDRQAFETVIDELGLLRLDEQLCVIAGADEQLRQREEFLSRECTKRVRLIRTLGMAGGAAVFLILI